MSKRASSSTIFSSKVRQYTTTYSSQQRYDQIQTMAAGMTIFVQTNKHNNTHTHTHKKKKKKKKKYLLPTNFAVS